MKLFHKPSFVKHSGVKTVSFCSTYDQLTAAYLSSLPMLLGPQTFIYWTLCHDYKSMQKAFEEEIESKQGLFDEYDEKWLNRITPKGFKLEEFFEGPPAFLGEWKKTDLKYQKVLALLFRILMKCLFIIFLGFDKTLNRAFLR